MNKKNVFTGLAALVALSFPFIINSGKNSDVNEEVQKKLKPHYQIESVNPQKSKPILSWADVNTPLSSLNLKNRVYVPHEKSELQLLFDSLERMKGESKASNEQYHAFLEGDYQRAEELDKLLSQVYKHTDSSMHNLDLAKFHIKNNADLINGYSTLKPEDPNRGSMAFDIIKEQLRKNVYSPILQKLLEDVYREASIDPTSYYRLINLVYYIDSNPRLAKLYGNLIKDYRSMMYSKAAELVVNKLTDIPKSENTKNENERSFYYRELAWNVDWLKMHGKYNENNINGVLDLRILRAYDELSSQFRAEMNKYGSRYILELSVKLDDLAELMYTAKQINPLIQAQFFKDVEELQRIWENNRNNPSMRHESPLAHIITMMEIYRRKDIISTLVPLAQNKPLFVEYPHNK